MSDQTLDELAVVMGQLDELLAEGAVDEDDALEIAALAGLVARLGGDKEALAEALAWCGASPGKELLAGGWELLDPATVLDAIEACADGDVSPSDVEDAVFELDELVAASMWCGEAARMRKVAIEAEKLIRMVPEPFASLSEYAKRLARLPQIAQDLDMYGYWLAIADAGEYADDEVQTPPPIALPPEFLAKPTAAPRPRRVPR